MKEDSGQQHSYAQAIKEGNLPLMRIRLDEEYSEAFDKYERLVILRRNVLSDERREEAEKSGLLSAVNGLLQAQVTELSIQEKEKEGAEAYFKKIWETSE